MAPLNKMFRWGTGTPEEPPLVAIMTQRKNDKPTKNYVKMTTPKHDAETSTFTHVAAEITSNREKSLTSQRRKFRQFNYRSRSWSRSMHPRTLVYDGSGGPWQWGEAMKFSSNDERREISSIQLPIPLLIPLNAPKDIGVRWFRRTVASEEKPWNFSSKPTNAEEFRQIRRLSIHRNPSHRRKIDRRLYHKPTNAGKNPWNWKSVKLQALDRKIFVRSTNSQLRSPSYPWSQRTWTTITNLTIIFREDLL